MAKAIKFSFKMMVYLFALIGFVLVAGFFAVRLNLTNTPGKIDQNNSAYATLSEKVKALDSKNSDQNLYQKEVNEKILLCRIDILAKYAPANAEKIFETYQNSYDKALTEKMIFALEVRLNQNAAYSADKDKCQQKNNYVDISTSQIKKDIGSNKQLANAFPWVNQEEWSVITTAIGKDKDPILTAAKSANIDPRFIVSACIVEQLRLYHTQREVYEKVFKPLQILGNANQMAWGVMSIKEKTAIKIEENLRDSDSPYYLGPEYENLLNFSTNDPSAERYQRLTDEKNHFYSYLYGGLYLKEIMKQWSKAGFPIDDRPEIVGTLFNLGFEKSQPKKNPEVGGSTIDIGNASYTFGALAFEFYYSGEMTDSFPLQNTSTSI